MSDTKTLEQLQAEAKAAAEALAAAQDAAREAERAAKREEERKAREAAEAKEREAREKAFAPVRAALAAAGIKPDALRGNTAVTVEAEERGGSYSRGFYSRSRATGRYLVVVGERFRDDRPVRYPPKADGTYSVDKIVAKVRERIDAAAAREARESKEKSAEMDANALAARTSAELGYTKDNFYSSPVKGTKGYHAGGGRGPGRWVQYTAGPGKVLYEAGTLELTPERAKELHAFLTRIGVKK